MVNGARLAIPPAGLNATKAAARHLRRLAVGPKQVSHASEWLSHEVAPLPRICRADVGVRALAERAATPLYYFLDMLIMPSSSSDPAPHVGASDRSLFQAESARRPWRRRLRALSPGARGGGG